MAATAPYVFARSRSAYHGPDSVIVQDQLFKLRHWYEEYGPAEFAEKFFWILRKKPEKGENAIAQASEHWNKRLVPFRHNNIQQDINKRLTQRNIFLKPRQGGYTTYMIIMRLLLPALIDPGVGCLLISQTSGFSAIHFSMLRRAFKFFGCVDPFNLQDSSNDWWRSLHKNLLHTAYSSRKELILDATDSRIMCASAEVEEAGQGITISHLACTEVARWEGNPEETLANVKESVTDDGTVDLESTANNLGGYFYEECQRAKDGKSEFTYHFHPWYFHEEYTLENKPVKPESLTEEEKSVIKSAGKQYEIRLTLGHIAWRRMKIKSLRHNFPEKYPEDEISCFLLQGHAYFDTEILITRLKELEGEAKPRLYQKLSIHKKPQKNKRYIIGVDPKGGLSVTPETTDYACMVVKELETGEQCASYRSRLAPEEVAADAAELGRMYNNALVAVERTGDGGTVMLVMQTTYQYTNIYKHRDWWKRDWAKRNSSKGGGGNMGNKFREIEGFPTSQKTRPIALNRVASFIRNSPELIHDIQFVREALTFVRDPDKRGIPSAAPGAHDDSVSCEWIAEYCRLVTIGYLFTEDTKSESYDENDQEEEEVEEDEE